MDRRKALAVAATSALTCGAAALAVAANLGLLTHAQDDNVGKLSARNVAELTDVKGNPKYKIVVDDPAPAAGDPAAVPVDPALPAPATGGAPAAGGAAAPPAATPGNGDTGASPVPPASPSASLPDMSGFTWPAPTTPAAKTGAPQPTVTQPKAPTPTLPPTTVAPTTKAPTTTTTEPKTEPTEPPEGPEHDD